MKKVKIEIYEEIAEIGLSFRDLRFFLKKRKKNICKRYDTILVF